MTIPLVIGNLSAVEYGIWAILLNLVSWINVFDFGIGNGLRNKLVNAVVKKDYHLVSLYINSAYFSIGCISAALVSFLCAFIPFLNLNKVFNTVDISSSELLQIVLIMGSFVSVNFILSLINQIFYAYQKASFTGLMQLISGMLFFLYVVLMGWQDSTSLIYLCLGYGSINLIVYLIFTYIFFDRFDNVCIGLKYVSLAHIKEILNLGVCFFLIQISSIILFMSSNMLIVQLLGPEHVRTYDLVYKIFSIIIIAHGILSAPLWSAYSEAYLRKDFVWIRNTIKMLNLLMVGIVFGCVIISINVEWIIKIWVGVSVEIPPYLVDLMAIFTIISTWNNIYAYFLNGISQVKLQLYTAIIAGIINIPMAIYFVKQLELLSSGIVLATTISLSIFAVIGPLQTYYIVFIENRGGEKDSE